MKVLLVTQYFYPENFKSNDIAFELVKKGYKVDVLTSIPNYPQGHFFKGYGFFNKRVEEIDSVNVYRAFQLPRGKKGSSIRLSLNYLSYAFCASFWAIYLAIFKKYDCVIVHQTSPITQAMPAIIIKKIQNIPLYTWVLDIWPDSVVFDKGINNKWILSVLDRFVKFVYNQSNTILTSSKQFSNLIESKGDYASKIQYFPNWSEDILKMPLQDIPNLPEGFIIMMAGNIGIAQTVESIMSAALEMRDEKYVKWVFVGDGSKKVFIDDYVIKHNLSETVFTMGRYPFSTMPAFFHAANAMLLTLKANFPHLKAVVPSRLQSYMAAARPVLAMVDGGGAEIINESKCGFAVGADDYLALVEVIRKNVLTNRGNFEMMGENGRRYFEENFTKELCIQHLISLIDDKTQC